MTISFSKFSSARFARKAEELERARVPIPIVRIFVVARVSEKVLLRMPRHCKRWSFDCDVGDVMARLDFGDVDEQVFAGGGDQRTVVGEAQRADGPVEPDKREIDKRSYEGY